VQILSERTRRVISQNVLKITLSESRGPRGKLKPESTRAEIRTSDRGDSLVLFYLLLPHLAAGTGPL
jgi:hypothetical protein